MDTDIDLINEEVNKKNNCPKKNIIIISIITALILIAVIILVIILTKKKKEIFDIKFDYQIIQSDMGTQNILVNWTSKDIFNISI